MHLRLSSDFFSDLPPLEIPCIHASNRIAEDNHVEKVILEKVKTLKNEGKKIFGRIKKIPTILLKILKDWQWTLLAVEIFGSVEGFCLLLGRKAEKFFPPLTFLTGIFYLYHACTYAKDRLNMMKEAIKAQRVSEAFFYGSWAINSVGAAVGDISKGLAGGARIVGIHQTPVLAFAFTVVIPIALIVTGSVGGLAKGWTLWRNAKALKRFNNETEGADEDVNKMIQILEFLRGEQFKPLDASSEMSVKDRALLKIKKQFLRENYFSNEKRQQCLHEHIDSLLKSHDFKIPKVLAENWSSDVAAILLPFSENLQGSPEIKKLIKDIEGLYRSILESQNQDQTICVKELFSLYDQIKKLFQDERFLASFESTPDLVNDILEDIENNRKELQNAILQEGNELLGMARSDMHRLISYNALYVLMAAMILTSGILFLIAPEYKQIATIISLSTAAIDICYILFDKTVSQKRFYDIEKFFKHLVSHRPVIRLQSQVRTDVDSNQDLTSD